MLLPMIWMTAMALGLALSMIAAVNENHGVHFALSIVFAGFMAIMAVRDRNALLKAGSNTRYLAADAVRYMGFIWSWAAANVALVYATLIVWPTWMMVTTMLVICASTCFFVARVIDRNNAAGSADDGFERFVGLIAKSSLGVACALFGCLIAAGLTSPTAFAGQPKWIAMNVLMATAIAIAVLSFHVVVTTAEPTSHRTA